MNLSTHVTVGAFLGLMLSNLLVGFFVGIASHFILDFIPHGDSRMNDLLRVYKKKKAPFTYGTIDAVFAIYLILFFMPMAPDAMKWTLSATIAGSVLPDMLVGIYEIVKLPILRDFYKMHFAIHNALTKKRFDIGFIPGLICQLALISILIISI